MSLKKTGVPSVAKYHYHMNYTIHVVSKSQFILIAISQNVDLALMSQQKESIKFDIAT